MKKTILLYGRSGSGKTTLAGELSEHVKSTTGLNTRMYIADRGGIDAIRPYVDLKIIDPVFMGDSDPWVFTKNASLGNVRKDGKWVKSDEKIGLYVFESMASFADALMESMKEKAANNVNIGGGANVSFKVAGDGESFTVGGSNMAHYGVAQGFMTEKIWKSQLLDASYVMWTSSVSKDEDSNSGGKVLGPDVIGKVLTPKTPGWFNLTFRLDVKPAQMGKPESHILYMSQHVDLNAGNVAALGNNRLPLDAKPLEKLTIEPASIVAALKALEGGNQSATDAIRKRLGDKLK